MSRHCLRTHAWLAVAGCAVLALCGCQYHWGSVMHPQIRSLAVGRVVNQTKEPIAAALLRSGIAEALSTEPGVSLTDPDRADAIVEGKVLKIKQRRLARALIRHDRVVQDDSDAYQTVLYRMQVTVEYQVRFPGSEKPFIEPRQVVGEADMGNWPDQQVHQEETLRRALNDASAQIVSALTEAW